MRLAYELRDALSALPDRPVSELVLGQPAHLRGRIRCGQTLEAPLSGAACVYWAVDVVELVGLDAWILRQTLEAFHDFELVDDSGAVLVLAHQAKVAAANREVFTISPKLDVPLRVDDFTIAHAIETRDVTGDGPHVRMRNKTLELRETKLVEDDLIDVLGDVIGLGARPDMAGPSYRQVAMRLALGASDRQGVVILAAYAE